MHNKEVLAAIAYTLNAALESDTLRDESDTEAAHEKFVLDLTRGRDEIEQLLSGDAIASIWTVDDVYSVAEDREYGEVTEQQAKEVLQSVERNHDANYGINWDTLADTLYPMLQEKK